MGQSSGSNVSMCISSILCTLKNFSRYILPGGINALMVFPNSRGEILCFYFFRNQKHREDDKKRSIKLIPYFITSRGEGVWAWVPRIEGSCGPDAVIEVVHPPLSGICRLRVNEIGRKNISSQLCLFVFVVSLDASHYNAVSATQKISVIFAVQQGNFC